MGRFLKGLGLFLALVGVGIVSAFAVIALLLRQEEQPVPDLTGLELVNALATVRRQGLQLAVDRQELHPSLPHDAVISQFPAPGSGIKKGRLVHVVVSRGQSALQALKLVGENFRKADILIRRAGFVPGTVSRVSSDSVERDIVIAQDPEPGSPLQLGGGINMLVSGGEKIRRYAMPKLMGKKADEAAKVLERIGLKYRIVIRSEGDRAPGIGRIVIQQKPGAWVPVGQNDTVELVVSR